MLSCRGLTWRVLQQELRRCWGESGGGHGWMLKSGRHLDDFVLQQSGCLEAQHWNREDSRSQRRVGGIVCSGFMRGGTHRQEEQEEEDMQTGVRGAEITYSRHPGWLWQSEWALAPPGRVWPPSTGFSCSGQRDLETTPRLWRLRSCKQRQGWVRGEVTQRSLTRSERTLVEVVCSCRAHRSPFITKSQDRKPRECPKQTTKLGRSSSLRALCCFRLQILGSLSRGWNDWLCDWLIRVPAWTKTQTSCYLLLFLRLISGFFWYLLWFSKKTHWQQIKKTNSVFLQCKKFWL